MEYIKLGNSDLNVSRICMGCMGFGDPRRGQHTWTLDEAQTRNIIEQGLKSGINFFDTAIAYQSGTSEQYVGKAIRDMAHRDDVVIATKFLPRTDEEIEKGISGQQHIEIMLNQSLQNLGMDHVDLYIYHMWDYRTPLYEIMDGLNRMVQQGKTRYIGISNCFAWQLAKANALAEKEGFAKFITVQGHYNLIFREEEREMITFCFLMAQGGCEPQLIAHTKGNMNMGNDADFLRKVIAQCVPYIGYPRSLNAMTAVEKASQ